MRSTRLCVAKSLATSSRSLLRSTSSLAGVMRARLRNARQSARNLAASRRCKGMQASVLATAQASPLPWASQNSRANSSASHVSLEVRARELRCFARRRQSSAKLRESCSRSCSVRALPVLTLDRSSVRGGAGGRMPVRSCAGTPLAKLSTTRPSWQMRSWIATSSPCSRCRACRPRLRQSSSTTSSWLPSASLSPSHWRCCFSITVRSRSWPSCTARAACACRSAMAAECSSRWWSGSAAGAPSSRDASTKLRGNWRMSNSLEQATSAACSSSVRSSALLWVAEPVPTCARLHRHLVISTSISRLPCRRAASSFRRSPSLTSCSMCNCSARCVASSARLSTSCVRWLSRLKRSNACCWMRPRPPCLLCSVWPKLAASAVEPLRTGGPVPAAAAPLGLCCKASGAAGAAASRVPAEPVALAALAEPPAFKVPSEAASSVRLAAPRAIGAVATPVANLAASRPPAA
mmetsp:Transcript_109716/g.354237  ORF Transcript_109716/g.354237 Transcript_109716/m.354237 type:complete len:465 (+) Transcript_109716:300-1694(+)